MRRIHEIVLVSDPRGTFDAPESVIVNGLLGDELIIAGPTPRDPTLQDVTGTILGFIEHI